MQVLDDHYSRSVLKHCSLAVGDIKETIVAFEVQVLYLVLTVLRCGVGEILVVAPAC
jgi:hypothetical protein